MTPKQIALKCAEMCESVDEITLMVGRPISTEAEFHTIVRDLFFLKAKAIRAFADTLSDEGQWVHCKHIWYAGDQGCRKCGAPKGDSNG